MHRKTLAGLLLVFIWFIAVGMGRPGPEVPIPETHFSATVRDDQDVSTRLQHASWEGKTYFSGMRGKGTVTVAFDRVKKAVNVGTGSEKKIDFQVTLKTGEVVAVSLQDDGVFQGTTSFGTFRILAKNIKEIVFE